MSDTPRADAAEPRCGAKAYPVLGQAEPIYLCPHCGDVTNEPRCPHDTPRQSNSGLDI